MIGKPGFVVGFIRTWGARYPITEQRKKMDNHEISRVYDDFDLLIRQRRPGDTVAVTHLHLLADPKRKYRRANLLEALRRIEATGSHVLELSTGLKTKNRSERDTMLINACEAMALGRIPTQGGKIGRPKRKWDERDTQILMRHWHSLKHSTDAVAVLAMRADGVMDVTPSIVRKLLGNSGRRPGSRPKRK